MSTNVSNVTSHFPDAENGFTTTTSGAVASGAPTVGLNSTTGYTNGEPVVMVIDPASSSKKQTFTGLIDTSGNQVTSVVWTAGTNVAHDLGATVVDYATATHIAMMSKGIKVDHTQAGYHKTLSDSNGNRWIKQSATTSAVNEVTVTNAATNTDPRLSASGDDTNINLNLRGKGLAKTVTIGAGAATIFPYDYVVSGCVITGTGLGTTLGWSMTAGVVVINGNPITVATASGTVTASKDTYFDVLDAGDGTGTLVNTGGNIVANNAASPALVSNSIRIGIVVSGAGSIAAATSINQGQETMVLPIASSIPYAVTDSLGNLICPRDPNRKILGYRQITSNTSTASTSPVQIVGLTCPVIVPTGRKVSITTYSAAVTNSTANKGTTLSIWDGTVGSGTQLQQANSTWAAGVFGFEMVASATTTPTATSKTYNTGMTAEAGTSSFAVGATFPTFIKVELV